MEGVDYSDINVGVNTIRQDQTVCLARLGVCPELMYAGCTKSAAARPKTLNSIFPPTEKRALFPFQHLISALGMQRTMTFIPLSSSCRGAKRSEVTRG